jgi:hypothetical protein
MPDDNRFAGLGEQLSEAEREQRAAAASEDGTTGSGDPDAPTPDDETEPAEAAGGPAFAFDETSPKSLYVRAETLDLFEDTEFEVESVLRRDHGLRDLTSREFHDALVHVAADHVEEIAARIETEREE